MQEEMKTVLVVDDAAENIAVLVSILKSSYKVKVAKDGPRALGIAQSGTPPDVVLLDVMMPGMDGYEVCQQLKSNAATGKIPIIFVSGHEDPAEQAKGLALGAVAYLSKPVNPDSVLATVSSSLDAV